MAEPLTLIKLIILYMLDQIDFPLSKAQIYDFILEKEYTNYFTLQQATCELIDSNFVASVTTHNSTLLTLTAEGRETLHYFRGRIADGIRQDINTYFDENRVELHNEVSVTSNYYRNSTGEYVADLSAHEKAEELINIKLALPTEEAAEAVCRNWKQRNQEVYSFIIEKLM